MQTTETTQIIETTKTPLIKKVNKTLHEHRVAVFQCIPALVIFLLATYRLSEIGQPILFNDEIGYWSNSAFFMGMDWTSVTGRIGYYSYGYSLLLIPIRILAQLFGWQWDTMYRAAVVMNAGFLVISYVLALRLAKRYLTGMGDLVRTVACFALFTYSSYIVYAHITWTECTLMLFFWVFLYVMMRVVDAPGIGNHIVFAVVSFYIYTVHQRALGIMVSSIVFVLYMRLLRRNTLKDTAAFFGSIYLYSMVHAMVKSNLQNVNYLGAESEGWRSIAGYALTKKSLLILLAGGIMFMLLWMLEKGYKKAVLGIVMAGVLGIVILFLSINNGYLTGVADALSGIGGAANRLSVNDFSGQWGAVKNIFTLNGIIRLGISITGKWFYLASATGLVICWGIYGLFENAFILLRGHEPASAGSVSEQLWKDRIWLLGVLLACFSTFMISAVYKEGLYKNDDLVNGRYTEFVLGFVLLYGLYRLLNDKKWVRATVIYVILYILAGRLCQYAWDELQRKEFELAHCVMFGRVVWNYEVPYGKVAQIEQYIRPMVLWFMVLLKPARERFPKVMAVRTVLALMIPVIAWSYLGKTIVDAYVVVRNEKQAQPFVQLSDWIHILENGEKVYYIVDSANDRNPGLLQFMLCDQSINVVGATDISYEEDAFYIMKEYFWTREDTAVADECEEIVRINGYILAINKNQNLARRWKPFRE